MLPPSKRGLHQLWPHLSLGSQLNRRRIVAPKRSERCQSERCYFFVEVDFALAVCFSYTVLQHLYIVGIVTHQVADRLLSALPGHLANEEIGPQEVGAIGQEAQITGQQIDGIS